MSDNIGVLADRYVLHMEIMKTAGILKQNDDNYTRAVLVRMLADEMRDLMENYVNGGGEFS